MSCTSGREVSRVGMNTSYHYSMPSQNVLRTYEQVFLPHMAPFSDSHVFFLSCFEWGHQMTLNEMIEVLIELPAVRSSAINGELKLFPSFHTGGQ